MRCALCASLLTLILPLTLASPSQAQHPATAGVLQLDAGFRYGIDFEDEGPNPFGVGLGFGLGHTLPNSVYVGGVFDYFFGETVTDEAVGSEITANVWQVMGEGGYDLALSQHWVLRGKGGLGYASLSSEACVDVGDVSECEDASEGNVALAPGAGLLYLGESFTLSVDGRYDMVLAEEMLSALILSFGIGF